METVSLEDQPVATQENRTERVAILEKAALVRKCMASLRAAERRVLELAISEGMPLGTGKTHARRGLIRLWEMLEADSASRFADAET